MTSSIDERNQMRIRQTIIVSFKPRLRHENERNIEEAHQIARKQQKIKMRTQTMSEVVFVYKQYCFFIQVNTT